MTTEDLETQAREEYMGYGSLEEAMADYEYTSQAEALARMLSQENVFLSGPAGSGKSHLVTTFVNLLQRQFGNTVNIAITATTGLAATNIGGRTIHSWSGIGIKRRVPFRSAAFAPEWIPDTDVLIIDEISMMPAFYLDLVDKACQIAKRNDRPFGGIQVIFLGDFLQLPPVPNRDAREEGLDQRFAVFSDAWTNAEIKSCYLDKTKRSTDPELTRVLQDMAQGTITQETVNLVLKRRSDIVKPDENKTYAKLYTTNERVDAMNQSELKKNPNRERRFYSEINPLGPMSERTMDLIKNAQKNIPEFVALKEAATVMVTRNGVYSSLNEDFSPGNEIYVPNGSIGTVVSIGLPGKRSRFSGMQDKVYVRLNSGDIVGIEYVNDTKEEYVKIGEDEKGKPITKERPVLSIRFLPMKLAYAITVHKSQGQTLDGVIVDLSKCFVAGLGYVALSRVRKLDDMIVEDLNKKSFEMDEDGRRFMHATKISAKQEREQFKEDIEHYHTLLKDEDARFELWKDIITGR